MFEKVNILRSIVIVVVAFVAFARRVITFSSRPRSFGIYLLFCLKKSTYPVPETLLKLRKSSSKHGTLGEIKIVNDLRGS
jgi:hypothetical protein